MHQAHITIARSFKFTLVPVKFFPTLPASHPTSNPFMDEHYDFSDASEQMSLHHQGKITLTNLNPGNQLEEWTNVRNTKNQYNKQLHNFLKVSVRAMKPQTTPSNLE